MIEEVHEAWRIHEQVHRMLLEAISEEGFACTLSKRGGRSVARQFAHVHNVRGYHLQKRAKALSKGLRKFATAEEPSRDELVEALDDSGERVAEWLQRAHDGEKGMRVFRGGVVPMLGYLIAHESHHRGSILLTLKTCGHPVEKAVRDNIWSWNSL